MPAVAPKIGVVFIVISHAEPGPPIPAPKAKEGSLYYVYLLHSKTHPSETYTGSTSDLRRRFAEHNVGKSIHTNKFKPWDLVAYIALPEVSLAEKFEKYLKSGSGRAFAMRHFLM